MSVLVRRSLSLLPPLTIKLYKVNNIKQIIAESRVLCSFLTEFSETWLLGRKGIATWELWYEDQTGHIEADYVAFSLFTRFLRVLLCDLILKPFVYQHTQVLWYICFSSQYQVRFYQCPIESTEDLLHVVIGHWLFFSPSVEKLQSLSDEEWAVFLLQLCSSLEEQNPSTAPPPPHSTATRTRLNLLCYLCCVVGHKVITNRLMNSTLVGKHVFTPDYYWLDLTRSFFAFLGNILDLDTAWQCGSLCSQLSETEVVKIS